MRPSQWKRIRGSAKTSFHTIGRLPTGGRPNSRTATGAFFSLP